MADKPTKYTVLGTLVDRAVCMPYAKPQVLRRGYRRQKDEDSDHWTSVTSVREDVASAATFLVAVLKARGARGEWSRAALAVDPAGPWWSKTRTDFFSLAPGSRRWILDRLEVTADSAAMCIEEEAIERKWTWLWSQPALATPGPQRPSITRPDLIGGLDSKRCDVIDLKTTSTDDLQSVVKSGQSGTFDRWAEALSAMGFVPEAQVVLIVSSTEDRWEWLTFPSTR